MYTHPDEFNEQEKRDLRKSGIEIHSSQYYPLKFVVILLTASLLLIGLISLFTL